MPIAKKPDETPVENNWNAEPVSLSELVTEVDAETQALPAAPPPGRYRFIYLDKTIYPALGLTVEHGDEHDWPDGPPSDGRWTLADERK